MKFKWIIVQYPPKTLTIFTNQRKRTKTKRQIKNNNKKMQHTSLRGHRRKPEKKKTGKRGEITIRRYYKQLRKNGNREKKENEEA